VNAAVPPCFPALDQGRTAWAALTGGGRRRLLYFTGAICPLDWGWQGEFDLCVWRSAAPAGLLTELSRLADGRSTTPAVMFISMGLIVAYLVWVRQYWSLKILGCSASCISVTYANLSLKAIKPSLRGAKRRSPRRGKGKVVPEGRRMR